MGGGKETPRQKMIGMMYLVLLALLAMNVSKSIIQAFITLNSKMEASVEPVLVYNAGMTDELENKIAALVTVKADPAAIANAKMHKVTMDTINSLTKNMWNQLIEANYNLLVESVGEASLDGMTGDEGEKIVMKSPPDERGYMHLHDLNHFTKKDDYDTPTRLFVGSDHNNIAEAGKAIVDGLLSYRNKLCTAIANYTVDNEDPAKVKKYDFDVSGIPSPKFLSSDEDRKTFREDVEKYIESQHVNTADKEVLRDIIVRLTIPEAVMNHGEEYPWIAAQFDHAPIVAATAVFTSLRSDIVGVETLASQTILGRVKAPNFSFNKIEPLAFASSSYINQGDSIGLKVMMAAYDSTEDMKLRYWVDDTAQIKLPVTQRDPELMTTYNGKASSKITFQGSAPGDHFITGEIAVKEKGVEKWKPWDFHYSVGSPSAAVSAADLQVLYKGWKNKIKIAAAGYSSEKVTVSCSGCSISSSADKDGNYTATVTRGKEAFITVSAVDDNGKKVELAKERFRIFNLPPPTAYFGGKAGGKMSKLDALQIPILTANLGESPLDVPYEVVQFSMLGMSNGNPITLTSKSRVLTKDMKGLMKRIPPNGSLTFTNIKVKGPAGVQSLESGVVLKLTK